MKPYAEIAARRTRQVVADLVALCWLIVFIVLAKLTVDQIELLRAPTDTLSRTGSSVAQMFGEAASLADQIPFIGGGLASALQQGQAAGNSLVQVAAQQSQAVSGLSGGGALLVILVGVLPLLVLWLPVRLRYAHAAAEAATCREDAGGRELLALHALQKVPAAQLREITDNPAASWRQGDAGVVTQLAQLRLSQLGLFTEAPSPGAPAPEAAAAESSSAGPPTA
ncbi:MAG TPA: hypothetical protein VFE65_08850 [Pseudonocardia sp.]|jgi:hypothetical protein|nr:hypothetical protein [Pseudonocardia sp.]